MTLNFLWTIWFFAHLNMMSKPDTIYQTGKDTKQLDEVFILVYHFCIYIRTSPQILSNNQIPCASQIKYELYFQQKKLCIGIFLLGSQILNKRFILISPIFSNCHLSVVSITQFTTSQLQHLIRVQKGFLFNPMFCFEYAFFLNVFLLFPLWRNLSFLLNKYLL